jgi:hypothetical protein
MKRKMQYFGPALIFYRYRTDPDLKFQMNADPDPGYQFLTNTSNKYKYRYHTVLKTKHKKQQAVYETCVENIYGETTFSKMME